MAPKHNSHDAWETLRPEPLRARATLDIGSAGGHTGESVEYTRVTYPVLNIGSRTSYD